MTAPLDLQDEILRILEAETGRPLRAASVREVLRCAVGLYLADGEVEAALDALLLAGMIERVHSARVGVRYRIMRTKPGCDLSAPEPPRAA